MLLPTALHTTQQPSTALCLLGPTASGKTAAALALATQFPIEIISVDSALVYRDMDIGTAKPSAAEQARCPHHLIDIISPEQSYSAARFVADTRTLIAAIRARGNIPLLCGGTMLYFKALREGLSDLPQADAELRQQINERAARLGWPALHAELTRHDPETAQRLEPTDAQRIQRALEIFYLTHQPASLLYRKQTGQTDSLPSCPLHLLVLRPDDRTILHQRIEQRFTAMLNDGLVDEVKQLKGKYALTPDLPSLRTVGYRQAWQYLENEYDYDTLRFRGIVATRQLAKRQLTWMRQFRENWDNWTEYNCFDTQLHSRLQQHVDRILAHTFPAVP